MLGIFDAEIRDEFLVGLIDRQISRKYREINQQEIFQFFDSARFIRVTDFYTANFNNWQAANALTSVPMKFCKASLILQIDKSFIKRNWKIAFRHVRRSCRTNFYEYLS